MARTTHRARPRPRVPLWQMPIRLAASVLQRVSAAGVDNAARALDEEQDARRTVETQIEELDRRPVRT